MLDIRLIREKPDFVREPEAVGHDAEFAVFVAREISVGQVRAQGVHPVLHLGGDRHPDTVLRVAEHEIHLADRLAGYRIF